MSDERSKIKGSPASIGRLTWRNLVSRKVRSLLTIGAIAVAIFLLCFVRSIVTSLDAAVGAAKSNRVIVGSAVSLFQNLPTAYLNKIKAVDGVEQACNFSWFGGRYQKPENFFAQFGTDPKEFLEIYDEVDLPEQHKKNWIADRKGCIVGVGLAEKYDFKVGQTIPIIGTIYVKSDMTQWSFNIHGIYRSSSALVDEQTLYFHWEYMDEVLKRGEAEGPRGSSVYVVRLDANADPAQVSGTIDDYYDGGPQRTRTQSEAAFQAGFISMLGNVPVFLGTIGGAVLIAILFGVVNTMTIAARERTRSMGILKAVGFPSSVPIRLYLGESVLLALIGGVVGIGLAIATEVPFRRLFGTQIPMFEVSNQTLGFAVLTSVLVGLIGGAFPAWRAARLSASESLRRGA